MDRDLFRSSILCIGFVLIAWFGNALYAIGAPGGYLKYCSPALVAIAMIAFTVTHGRRSEGGRGLAAFVATVFIVGWAFETVSILTGFPFGNYHYTDAMAPFLGHVPIFVMPAYCLMGYVCWAMARILSVQLDDRSSRTARFGVPLAAASLMVLWDLSLDPLRATVEGRWVWHDGGSHLGVPLLNFAGWFLVTWVMFQVYALLRRPSRLQSTHKGPDATLFWLTVPLMYLAFPVEYVLNPLVASVSDTAVSVNGTKISVDHIHASTAMLTMATMVPAALMAIYRIRRPETGSVFFTLMEETRQ